MLACFQTRPKTSSHASSSSCPNSSPSIRVRLFILLILFGLLVAYHGRLVEIASRLDFVWKETAIMELEEMAECRHYNSQLLRNILPDHVAIHFLSDHKKNQVRVGLNCECFFLACYNQNAEFFGNVNEVSNVFFQHFNV